MQITTTPNISATAIAPVPSIHFPQAFDAQTAALEVMAAVTSGPAVMTGTRGG